jgi:hypothetical protein
MTTTSAFVLGNGRSRLTLGISLDELKTYGPIYACNAIHREFKPDVLIATDKKMCQEIEATGYPMTHEFWTRRPAPEKGGRRLEKPYYGMSSGPAAASRAALRGFNNIYLIGFDFGSPNQFVNNIYAGTEHYKGLQDKATYYGNWENQIKQVIEKHPKSQFYRIMGAESTALDFGNVNIIHQDLDVFVNQTLPSIKPR